MYRKKFADTFTKYRQKDVFLFVRSVIMDGNFCNFVKFPYNTVQT